VRAGFAVLLLDFRSFGGSEGEPRHWVDPFRQVDDYRAALAFAQRELAHAVDARRIAHWGSSFSGGGSASALAAISS
jgi:alpha/beta superfamily hydrolase